MHDPIYIYIKIPAKNWRGYAWVYYEATRMSKTLTAAKKRFCEATQWHPDSVQARYN